MNEFWAQLGNLLPFNSGILVRLGVSLGIFVFALILRAVLYGVLLKGLERPRVRFVVRRTISYIIFFLTVVILIGLWSEGLSGLPTYLGLLSAGLAIAFKDPIANLIAWLYIITTRLFVIGDRIQIGADIGDVIDIQAFRIVALEVGNWVEADQTTGRIIYIPNARVFTETFRNYHAGFPFIWHEISVTLTFDSNWKKAKTLFLAVLDRLEGVNAQEAERSIQEASKQFYITQRTFTPTIYTRLREYGIVLTLRYLCDPRRRRQSEQDVVEELLALIAQHNDITLAYPTQKIYIEGSNNESTPT